jgi:hypothetical protein
MLLAGLIPLMYLYCSHLSRSFKIRMNCGNIGAYLIWKKLRPLYFKTFSSVIISPFVVVTGQIPNTLF